MSKDGSGNRITFGKILKMLGLGAVGTALGTGTAISAAPSPDRLFARQFVSPGLSVKLPKMVYDPHLQMMVDPDTGRAVYEDAKNINVASGYPTITAGCDDCPKKDDDGE